MRCAIHCDPGVYSCAYLQVVQHASCFQGPISTDISKQQSFSIFHQPTRVQFLRGTRVPNSCLLVAWTL